MITLDLTPTEEAQVSTIARQIGLAPADYIKKLVQEHLPPVLTEAVPQISAKNAAAIAQFQAWKEEDFTDDPEELRKADAELNELLENLNRNRIESGERPLFPE